MAEAGFRRCVVDHSIFIRRNNRGCVILAVYVDDIIQIGSDSIGILETKEYLGKHFIIKDMGIPRYFLGIEFAHKKDKMVMSQKKYALNLLEGIEFAHKKDKMVMSQ